MEICSIDISAAADRLNLLCCAAGREIMYRYAGVVLLRCRGGRGDMFQFVPSKAKGRYK